MFFEGLWDEYDDALFPLEGIKASTLSENEMINSYVKENPKIVNIEPPKLDEYYNNTFISKRAQMLIDAFDWNFAWKPPPPLLDGNPVINFGFSHFIKHDRYILNHKLNLLKKTPLNLEKLSSKTILRILKEIKEYVPFKVIQKQVNHEIKWRPLQKLKKGENIKLKIGSFLEYLFSKDLIYKKKSTDGKTMFYRYKKRKSSKKRKRKGIQYTQYKTNKKQKL